MKITTQHYNALNDSITEILIGFAGMRLIANYEEGDFIRSDRVKDLNARFRWDLYWNCVDSELREELDTYLKTDHIDTALRSIVPTIERKY